jgi:hypothetical protein
MSLTAAHHAFASVSQDGVNKALQAFFSARPHYLNYGSPPFVTASSVTETLMAPIPFPGTPGIPWAVDFSAPVVDLDPADAPLPPPLSIGPDQLALRTTVMLTIGCLAGDRNSDKRGQITPLRTKLDVVAVGHPVAHYYSPGVGDVSFLVDAVLIQGIAPPSLQAILDCIVRSMLNAVLAGVRLPFNVIDAGFFKLSLEQGPSILDDQIELWGDVS